MRRRSLAGSVGGFGLGFATAALLAAGLFLVQGGAASASPGCISTPFSVSGNIGTMADNTFSLVYEVPSCILSGGFKVSSVIKFNSHSVKIEYKK